MANPDDEKTVINVKGVFVSSWERAKKAANKQGQPMGLWLSRAADNLANLEDGPREFPPQVAANPESKTGNLSARTTAPNAGSSSAMAPETLAVMMRGMAALAAATGTLPNKATVRRAYSLMDDYTREAKGLPPAPVRLRPGKAAGQSLLLSSKADGSEP